ncbi:hypothetical protein Lal_00039918 [Lupinus albus]|nr:hypothetical protein Lal_00039918 [Lupinus albus]
MSFLFNRVSHTDVKDMLIMFDGMEWIASWTCGIVMSNGVTFITKILEHFGVSTVGETKVALNLRESKIDVELVHKMGFSIDPHDCRTYKH